MRVILGAALAALSLSVAAEIIAEAETQNGATLYFHSVRGECPEQTLRMEFVPPSGNTVEGCYMIDGEGAVYVVLADGRRAMGHVSMFRPPKKT